MKNKVKKIHMLAILAIVMLLKADTVAVEAGTNLKQPETITVSYADTLHRARTKASGYTKTYQWNSANTSAKQQDYATFTLKEKCFVELAADSTADTVPQGATEVLLYSDSAYTKKLGSTSFDHYMIDPIFLELDAGTYYVKTSVKNAFGGKTFTGTISVAAVREADGIQIQKKVAKNKDAVTIKISAKGFDGIETLAMKRVGSTDEIEECQKDGCQVKKNGKYRFCIKTEQDYVIYRTISVTEIDQTKPVIQGVKDGQKYSSATIRFSDKESGVKKALLNGETIKSGTKVTKKGTYMLKVWDNAGNLGKVKFTIS